MALTNLNINDALHNITLTAIHQSNYPMLKQHLLARKPIPDVIETLSRIIHENYEDDKEALIKKLTEQACAREITLDQHEQKNDEREHIEDNTKKLLLEQQLPELQNQARALSSNCSSQKDRIDQLNAEIRSYEASLSTKNSKLSALELTRSLNTIHHSHARTVHNHSQAIPLYPNTARVYHAHPNAALVSIQPAISSEEYDLRAEKAQLEALIDSKKSSCLKEKATLGEFETQRTALLSKIHSVNFQLTLEIPTRNALRHSKEQQRSARASARNTEDLQLQQLSANTHAKLKQDINNEIKKLDQVSLQLLLSIQKQSYPVFIDLLSQELANISMNPFEKESLASIGSDMKAYKEMLRIEKMFTQLLSDENKKLSSLDKQYNEQKDKIHQLDHSNEQKKKNITSLETQNEQLKKDGNFNATLKKGALFTALGGVLLGGAAGAVVGCLALNPFFFAIPAALGLIVVVALIVAAVYYSKQSNCDKNILKNSDRIGVCESSISSQTKENGRIINLTLPNLERDIEETTKRIQKLEADLGNHKSAMNKLLAKAENTNLSPVHTHASFFQSSAIHQYVPVPQVHQHPSAPHH